MPPRTSTPDADTEPPGLVPDLADELADLMRVGRTLGGERVARIVIVTVTGQETSLALPVPAGQKADPRGGLSQTARDILEVLEDRNGEWVFGADICADIAGHPDHRSTAFNGPVAELKKAGLIETSNRRGYRLKPNDS